MTDPLVRRRDAAQALLDAWTKRPMRLGRSDCARMTASHLRRLGWRVKLPASGSYASVRSARREIAKLGHADLAGVLDGMGLPRIAPAAAIIGDVLLLESADGLGCLTVSLGNGRVLGYHDDVPGGAAVLQPLEYLAAWRADPK
jgi:hypothetical protein